MIGYACSSDGGNKEEGLRLVRNSLETGNLECREGIWRTTLVSALGKLFLEIGLNRIIPKQSPVAALYHNVTYRCVSSEFTIT
jgi:hypothetical protein